MIKAELQGAQELQIRFDQLSKEMHNGIAMSILALTIELQRHVQQDKLSGQVLNTRTSNLRNSIAYRIENNGMTGVVGTNVNAIPYARIHEFGGIIAAKKANFLRFKIGDKWIFKKTVKMPERSYLRSALKDMEPTVKEEFIKRLQGFAL